MKDNNLNKMVFLALVAILTPAPGTAADGGAATVRVEIESGAPGAEFQFSGVVSGTVSAGDSITAEGVSPGAYTVAETSGAPGYGLVSITCDDENSIGYVSTSTARYVIDGSEAVSCTYLYRESEMEEERPGTSVPAQPEAPEEPDPPPPASSPPEQEPNSAGSTACRPPQLVPREGVWMVSNLPGTMVCAGMSMRLTPSQEPGTLALQECGWTVVASGFSGDTVDLIMHAVDATGRRYTGSVGGAQDGIPMTIDFEWILESDSAITGNLNSRVTQEGMTCTMSRPFEMRFTGN